MHVAYVIEASDFYLAEVDLQVAKVFHGNGTLLNQVKAPERCVGLIQQVSVTFVKLHPSGIRWLYPCVNNSLSKQYVIRVGRDFTDRWKWISTRRQGKAVLAIENHERKMRQAL